MEISLEHYNKMAERLTELEYRLTEQRWRPCSDVPDTDRNVFIARGNRDWMSVCIGHYENERWYEDRNWFATFLYDGLYWCEIPPLPEPYQEGDTDEQSQ